MEHLKIMNLLLESEGMLEFACNIVCASSEKLNKYQKEKLMSVLKVDCPSPILDSLSQRSNEESVMTELIMPPMPPMYPMYPMPPSPPEDLEDAETEACSTTEAPECVEDWVQCDCCDSWRKVDSLEGLPDKWYCSDIKKACRAPSEAENHWPARRAKYAVKFFYWGFSYEYGLKYKPYEGNRAPSHMECLNILAERKKITLEELYKTRPENYFGDKFNEFSRFMHGPANSVYKRYWL